MTGFSASGIRLVTACLLQLLWVFVHVAKQVHSHDRMGSTHSEFNGSQSKFSKTGCSICDCQLAKEAYGPNNEAPSFAPTSWKQEYKHHKHQWICRSISTASDRAPPASDRLHRGPAKSSIKG